MSFLPVTNKLCTIRSQPQISNAFYDLWDLCVFQIRYIYIYIYRSGNQDSPAKSINDQSPEPPQSRISLLARPFGLGWRDKNKVRVFLLHVIYCFSKPKVASSVNASSSIVIFKKSVTNNCRAQHPKNFRRMLTRRRSRQQRGKRPTLNKKTPRSKTLPSLVIILNFEALFSTKSFSR